MSESGWKYVALRDIATDIKDGTHGTHPRVESGIPFLSAKNIASNGNVVWSDEDDQIDEDEYRQITSGFSPKAGDLLITIVGSIGRTAVFNGDKVAFQRSVAFVRPNNDVLSEYLFQASSAPDFTRQLEQRSNSTAQAGLYLGELAKIRIPLPSEPKQHRIAEILSTLDEAIEQTEALIAKIQQIKSGLMHDMFTRGVTPEGHLRPTREQAPDLYKESPLGWIPKEWNSGRLDQYLDPTAGIKPGPFGSSLTKDNYVSSGFRVYGQEQVIAGTLEIGDYFISEAKFLEMSGFEVLADDVLISLVGTVGCVLVAKPPFERGIINPRLMRLRPARGVVVTSFLKHLLLSANVRRQIDILAGGGTMPVINGKIIRRLAIPILSYDEQEKVAERINVIDACIDSAAEGLAKLRQQKKGLMHDLLTGCVRV